MRDWGEEVLFLQIPTCTHMSTAPPPPFGLLKVSNCMLRNVICSIHRTRIQMQHQLHFEFSFPTESPCLSKARLSSGQQNMFSISCSVSFVLLKVIIMSMLGNIRLANLPGEGLCPPPLYDHPSQRGSEAECQVSPLPSAGFRSKPVFPCQNDF